LWYICYYNYDECNESTDSYGVHFYSNERCPYFTSLVNGEQQKLTITVRDETTVLGGIQTRVVEERAVNAQTGELKEIAPNHSKQNWNNTRNGLKRD